jgi:D-alanyl-D-alanine carboxypeptidase
MCGVLCWRSRDLESKKQRKEVARQLVDYAFRDFVQLSPIKDSQPLVRAYVSEGEEPTMLLGAFEGVRLTLFYGDAENVEARTSFENPIQAPVRKGDVVGKYQLVAGAQTIGEYPLVALEDVDRASFFARTIDNISISLGLSDVPKPEPID